MTNPSPVLYVSEQAPLSRLYWLLRRALVAAFEDNCFGIAKGAAYSALLSFFPVLTTTTAILVQSKAEDVSRVLSRILFQVAPPGTQVLLRHFLSEQGSRPVGLLVVAAVLSVWGASGAMISLMDGFQAAYDLPGGRSFLKQRMVAALLVLCAVVPLVFGSAMILLGARSERAVVYWLGLSRNEAELAVWVVVLSRVLRDLSAFSSIMLAAALLFYLGPNRPMRFRWVWPGALLATVLWLVVTQIFGWYVKNLAHYNVMYGSIAAVIALVVWMYVLGVVTLVGCEFNVAVEKDQWTREASRRAATPGSAG